MSIFSNNQIVEPGSEGISLPVFQPESGLQIPEVDAGIQESIDIQNDQEFANKLNEFSQLPETNEFRPKLAEHLSAYRQRTLLDNYRDPALTADEKARRKKAAESLDLLRDWDTDELARKRVEARWGKGFIERVQKASPEDRDEMLGMRLMVILGDGDGYKGHNEYNTRNSLWGQGVVTSAQVWQHFQASNKAAIDGEANAIRSARAVEQQLPTIAEELWKGNSMLQVLDKMPELDATAKVFLLTNCGYGSQFHEDVEDARQWAAKNGVQLTVSDEEVKRMEAQGWGTWSSGDAYIHPYGLSDEERQKKADKMVFNNGAYELGKKLVELKANNENAFNFVVGSLLSKVDRERNSGTAVLSPLASTFASMMESSWDFTRDLGQGPGRSAGLPAGMNSSMNAATDLNFTSRASDRTSDKEAEVISQIRAIKQSVAESPDGASWWRRFGDGLGRMAAQTAFFVGTQGVGTFTALSNDRIEELRGQGVGEMEATLRGFAAGGTEVLVERLGGESLFKTLRLIGLKMPFASRFAGYMGSATDMMRRGLYKSAAARYGVTSLAAGGSEWLEEVIQPTLQAPLDAGLARLFGSGNGMTVEDWKGQLEAAADPMLALQMVAFGAVAGGAQIPAFAREAQVSRVSAPQIMGLGVERAEAERIASIIDPVEKNREIFQAALSMSDRAAQLENVRQGFSSMKEDYSWLARQEAYQAEVELLNLPRVEDLGDGSWRFTTTVRDAKGKDSYDVLELNEQDATARMQALLHDGIRLRMLEAQQAFAVDKTINQLEGSGKYVFEDMGQAETVETARKLAEAARLRLAEGADVNAEAADLGTRMTYGQAAAMDEMFRGRVQLGVERGELASANRARSHAYRVAMRNGQTLIRFHKGEVTVPELLEEVLETHLTEDMENTKHGLDWYANNLRALQDALQKEGYLSQGKVLIRRDGEVSVRDVIEGMSMLAKGDVLARAADMRLPEWMKDFLQMVRQWVSSAKALLDLGTGLHEMERRRLAGESVPVDADFTQMVHALSNNLESYWLQEGARQGEADVQRILEKVAGSRASMSMAEDSSVSFSIVSIPESDVVTTAADMRARLKPLQGKVFVNKNTGIEAVIEARVSGKTVGKAGASQMSMANLKALGFSAEEARTIHYTAATRIHELFENAEDALFEEAYKDDPSRAGAYHFFNTVDIEGMGSFDVNVTVIALKEKGDNVLYTLELTIENPTARGATSHAGRLSTPFKDGVFIRNLSSYRSFVEKEKAAIKKKAAAEGMLMKAPNGADSNLTEDQWLYVRTKAFKNWFGDWEYDPANASKVVDENGEPLVVYHGSPNDFTVFDVGRSGENFNRTDEDGGLLFFSSLPETAGDVLSDLEGRFPGGDLEGARVYACFMRLRHPFTLDLEDAAQRPFPQDGVPESVKGSPMAWYLFPRELRQGFEEGNARGAGYDGILLKGRNAYDGRPEAWGMATDSRQVKSATDNRGTYDLENPDITFSVSALDADGTVLRPDVFVARPDGNPDWFTIPKRRGQAAMPVRLLVGEDTAFHKGYGLTHIAASRDLDGLWEQVSPERYLSSVLSNVSELWEISPGRELLVKGKKPSSWMVLQLVRQDGYYSIVTAHPVAGSKKPNGKKLPLAERVAGKNQTRVDRSQRPANPDAVPGAFPGGQESEAATLASTAGGGDASSLPPGARVVNINDVRLRFDDGRQMNAGFKGLPLAREVSAEARGMFDAGGPDVTFSVEEELEVQECMARLKEWVSPESIESARGKSRDEIFRLFGNELEPIAVIPEKYVRMFGSDVMDNRVYSGRGYFVDHAVNHHPEVALEDYQKLQDILSHSDEVALDDRDSGKTKLVFIKKYDKHGVVVVELGEAEDGKLFFHKTFFNKRSKPYPKLQRLNIEESSSVDGPSTISQTSKEAPGRDLSALDDVSLIADSGRVVNDSTGKHDVSLSLSEGSPLAVSRGTQSLEVVHRIAADLRADAATWGRYAGKTDEAAFLVNVGRNVSLAKSALMHLPAGYRVAVKPYTDRLQILAELAAKGKIDETRLVNAFARREIMREWREEEEVTARTTAAGVAWEKGKKPTQKFAKEVFEDEMEKVRKAWAENRLHELMAEVMEKAAGKLEALAKDGIAAGMARMLDQVLKVRKKNGKQQKGKVSMEAYTYLQEQVVPLLRMTTEEKEVAMNESAAELDRLEKENPDQMDGEAVVRMEELNEELTRLALYGSLEGMSVDEAEAAAKALEIYINTEKEGWAAVQEAAAERLNAIGRKIVERFNQTGKKADENSLRAANEKFHGKVSFKNFGDFMENMDQLLTRMGKMPALQEFTADMRSRLTNAFQQMRDARGLRAAAVQDLYERHLTERVMKARKVGHMASWVTWFKTSHDTGVRLNGWVTQTAQLTLEQAREVREMDSRQRKEFIRKRWEEGMEYFSEETLDVLLGRLKEHEEATARAKAEGKRPRYRKYVTAKVSFKGEEGSPLVLSRDNALYLVLQSEQEDYREMMKQQGYTPEVVAALREYVGEEGMAIGYGLRELLKAQGDKIGRLYEQVTGVPFPRVENYYPARFWALDAMSDADAADMISGVPSTKGGNQGWQKVRTKHHRRLDTSVGALSVFWDATDITDHWYYTQDVTADFRGLLRRREVAESLVANLGKDDFVRLRRWVDLLERAGVVQGQAVGSLDKLLNAVYSGQAKAILAFRFETLMKQGSAVLNAWIGDPSIGFWDYLGTMAKLRNGTAQMGVVQMLKSPEFQARLNDRIDVERLSRLKDDSSYTLAEAALVWGMNGIEYTDVFFNAVGSAALWNIKFRQAVKAGVEEGRAKDEAWQAVRDALHSAQPQSWIDKSFGGLHRGAFGRAIFYMMSENYNKTAAIYGLARAGFAPGVTPRQRWASLSKAGKVWLAYGAFNAIIGAMLDYMKDDEEEWEKRDWQGYLYAALAGPFAGMPLVGEAVEWLFSELLGAKVYTGSAGRALIDFRSGWNAAWKLGGMMQEGGHEAGDYMKQVIRLGRVFGAAGGVASGMTNKGIQAAGQYMTLGTALMNPVKTVVDVAD